MGRQKREFWNESLELQSTGFRRLRGTWDVNIPTYPLLLEDAGYHIGFSYKVWLLGTNPHAGYGGYRNAYNKSGTSFDKFSQLVDKQIRSGKSMEEAKRVAV